MKHIRKATASDASRLAEMLIFSKRIVYRSIFQNDLVSFHEMQVLPLALEYMNDMKKLENVWVFDDKFVKGMIHIQNDQIRELYVDPFFQHMKIGSKLIQYAITNYDVTSLWVLEKNDTAIQFYRSHGFIITKKRKLEQGTTEFIIQMRKIAHICFSND